MWAWIASSAQSTAESSMIDNVPKHRAIRPRGLSEHTSLLKVSDNQSPRFPSARAKHAWGLLVISLVKKFEQ